MRTIVTILLMMFLAQTTKAQEFIFETTAGEIVTKSKFIDQFQNDVYTNITPYILKQTTNESLQNGDSYTINCLKYRNWGNDPGDIHVIQVLHQGKEVFKLNNDEGWKYINEEPDGGITKTKFYYSIDLDKNTKVLIFVGIYIQSLPPYISLIAPPPGKAPLLFFLAVCFLFFVLYQNQVKQRWCSTSVVTSMKSKNKVIRLILFYEKTLSNMSILLPPSISQF